MRFEIPIEYYSQLQAFVEKSIKESEGKYLGAIGGLFTYSFTSTSIGMMISIKNNLTEETLLLSDDL